MWFDFTVPTIVIDIFRILYALTILFAIGVIVAENRNPVKTIAWILVLVFLPVIGFILYIFLGQDLSRRKIISRKSYRKIKNRPMDEFKVMRDLEDIPDAMQANLAHLFYNTNMTPPLGGNSIEFYTSGAEKFQALMEAIEQARHHVHLEYYIYENDEVGNRLRELLMRKAREGVEVRLLYDDVGCWRVPDRYFKRMREAGVMTYSFLRVNVPIFANKMNCRDHRKIVVVDGIVGFIGGMNVADRYIKGTRLGPWRDTHIKITGKGVYALQSAFMLNWYFSARTLITDNRYFPKIDNSTGNNVVQIVTSGPDSDWPEIMQGVLMAISSSKEYVYLQTPYFLPNEPILTALEVAALSGVDVRVMISGKSDTWWVQAASESYMKRILRARVKVYFYQEGFLHSKMMVFDDHIVSVGSSNLDIRSFEQNFEANAFIYNTQTAIKARRIFLHDQKSCQRITLKSWGKRVWTRRALSSVMRLLSPVL